MTINILYVIGVWNGVVLKGKRDRLHSDWSFNLVSFEVNKASSTSDSDLDCGQL